MAAAEQHLAEVNDEFAEDLDLIVGSQRNTIAKADSDSDSKNEELIKDNFEEAEEEEEGEEINEDDLEEEELSGTDVEDNMDDEENGSEEEQTLKRKNERTANEKNKKAKTDYSSEESDVENSENETWTDIYGRLRRKDGSVIEVSIRSITA